MTNNTPTPWVNRDGRIVRHAGDSGREILVNGFALNGGSSNRKEAEANTAFILEAVNNYGRLKQKADMFDEFMPEVNKMIKEAYELDAKLDVFNAKDRDILSFITIVLQNLQAFRDVAKQLTKESE